MSETREDQISQLRQTIAEMESQRAILGDETVAAALVPLRKKLAELEAQVEPTPEEPPEPPTRQRKLVTLLFMDVVGSTAMTQHLDPEDTLEIMDAALRRLSRPVEAHGGHVTRFMGDGFKAIFGDPVAREDDPEQAIRAGLNILDKSQALAKELKEIWEIEDFQVRIGIDTGLAALGGQTEAEDTVMGRVVNLAVRIESAAPPGGLLISHNTYRHVRGVFNVEPQEQIQAKGFPEPIPVYLVDSIKPRAFRVKTRGVEGVETRMVGRRVELLALQEAYRNAIEGEQTQVVTVVGEAGVGKSRLLYEFQNWLELHPDVARFFQGRGRQETQQLPYALLKDVFTFRFQIHESDKVNELRKKLEDGFCEVLGSDDEGQMRAHIIGQLFGFDFSESQHVKGILDDPQQIRDRALMYLAEYYQGMSEAAPTVIFLEDVHWADDSSLDMLNRMARRIPEQSLLIVCVARHRLYERRPNWGEGLAYHRRLELQLLSKHDSRQLVTEILQMVDQVPNALQELVVKGAEGNPFYIEELIKMLIEDGVILTGEEKWQVEPERLADIEVPDTLTGVLQARLEGLPPEERNTLQQASVVGHIFWDDAVEYIRNESAPAGTQSSIRTTESNLSSLRTRELIYHREESTFTDAAEYTFKHAVLRDVTYDSVLKRVRKAYHGLVAEWLIQHSGERAGEYTGLIADHLELAGKYEQAAIYLWQAGGGAAKRYANDEAVGYFTRALALTPEDDLVGRYDLLLAREKVHVIQGNHQAREEDLALLMEIVEALDDTGRRAQVTLHQMIFLYDTGNFPGTIEKAEQAIELARTARNAEIEAGINLRKGAALWQMGKNETARPVFERALASAREHDFHQIEADSLLGLGNVFKGLRDYASCQSTLEQVLEKYREIGDRQGEVKTLNNLALIWYETIGGYDKAISYFKQTLQLSREIGFRSAEAIVIYNLGSTALEVFDFDGASNYQPEALKIYQEIGDLRMQAVLYKDLGDTEFRTGNIDQAIRFYSQALKRNQEIGAQLSEVSTLIQLVENYCTLGDFNQAKIYYKQAEKNIKDIDVKWAEAWILIAFSWLMHYTMDNETAKEQSQQALHILGETGSNDVRWNGLIILGHALTQLGELKKAEAIYNQAVTLGFETQLPRTTLDALAGLARIFMARSAMQNALIQVEEILIYLETEAPKVGHPLDGTKEPFNIYLSCYQVLNAIQDPRAPKILSEAYTLLKTRADKISDEQLRHSFLNNVAANRDIAREYQSKNKVVK